MLGSTRPDRRRVVHLFADSAVAATFAEAGGRGSIVPWREVLTVGWTPSDCDLATWIKIRSRELSRELGLRRRQLLAVLRRQEKRLAKLPLETEVVLWAGPDLSCQLFLWTWLFRLEAMRPQPRVSMVSAPDIGTPKAPCLASLSGDRLRELARKRRTLTPVEIKLGAQAWRLLGASDPQPIRCALDSSWSSILDISRALHLHLLRFPEPGTGLGIVERKMLEFVRSGICEESELHRMLSTWACAFGFSTTHLSLDVRRLSSGRRAVLRSGPGGLSLTRHGARVLEGREDLVRLVGAPRAIGGTMLGRGRDWRFDPASGEILRPSSRRFRGDLSYA